MSVWGRRGTYTATAFVVTFFVFVSTVAYLAEPFIDKEENAVLKGSESDFMRMARFQNVRWREWGPEAIAEAKRKDRPILVVAGMPWGDLRQRFDSLFSVPEVEEYLNQEFVSIRVDALADPSWRSLPAPIARSLRNDPTDFFIGVFSAEGEVVAIPSGDELSRMSDVLFLAYMSDRLKEFAGRNESPTQHQALEEVADLRGGVSSGGIDAGDYSKAIEGKLQLQTRLVPYEMEFLLDEGKVEPVRAAVDRLLGSSATDLMWGGFFESWQGDFETIQFTKSGFSNAGMLRVLARLAASTGDARYLGAARWQFDHVLKRYAQETSSASDFSIWADASRSDYFSFSRTRLDRILKGQEREVAQSELGLVTGGNIQAMPRMAKLDDWSDGGAKAEPILEKMRRDVTQPERMQGQLISYESQAEAVRSVLLASRLLNDEERQKKALEAFDGLRQRMRIGVDDVLAGPASQPSISAGVGSYVAYSAAAWEAMLTGGKEENGWDGVQVLDRALFLFRDGTGSIWSGLESDFDTDWRKTVPTPVFDGSIPSGVGEVIRLCNLYGSWRGSKSHRGSVLRGRDKAVSQSSWALSEATSSLGTLALAVRQSNNGVAIGYEGDLDWAYWERNFPGVPLVPVNEEGADGFRFFKKGDWSGPHSVEELRELVR